MSTEKPLVSIVTPSLNQGKFIEQTILSVRAQSYPNLEHLIVDGGSTDQTLSILRKYDHTYKMRWVSEPDRGMYDAINKGMRRAQGEIVGYLNSDDLYFPWTIQVVVENFRRQPRTDFVYGDLIELPEGNYQKGAGIIFYPPEWVLRFHLARNSLGQPAVFWKRRVSQHLIFDESFRLAADYDFFIRALSHYRFRKINEVLAVFRTHRRSKSTNVKEMEEETTRVLSKSYGEWAIANAWERNILYQITWRYYTAKMLLFSACSKRDGAWKNFLRTNPVSLGWSQLIRPIAFSLRGVPRGYLNVDPLFAGAQL